MTPLCRLSIWLLLPLFLTGCALFPARIDKPYTNQTIQALEILKNRADRFPACRGLGQLKIENDETKRYLDLAWLCKFPDKARIEVLSPSGHSLLSFSTDGKYVYLQPRPNGKFQKYNLKYINLEKITGIPIKKNDILNLLAGALPLRRYSSIEISDSTSKHANTLYLKRRWGGTIEEFFFDDGWSQPYKATFFKNNFFNTSEKKIEYTAEITKWQEIDNFDIPRQIVLKTTDNITASLDIRKYWILTDVADDKFVLTAPAK